MVELQYVKLDPKAFPPTQAYSGDAGWDLFALEDTPITRGELTWVRTGLAMAVPEGHYGRVCGRSSAATRGFHVVEGVMDSGYRGEQLVRVIRLWDSDSSTPSSSPYRDVIRRGQSLGQLIITPIPQVSLCEVETLPGSERGERGFGSSGA